MDDLGDNDNKVKRNICIKTQNQKMLVFFLTVLLPYSCNITSLKHKIAFFSARIHCHVSESG